MRFAHTNIAAKDWKKLSDFYINVFECKIKPPQRNLSGKWLDKATGLTNAKLEGVHLFLPGHGDNPPTLPIPESLTFTSINLWLEISGI